MVESELAVVFVGNHLQAEIVKSRLESEGIPAILQYESAGRVYGFTVDGLGETRVLVPGSLADEARQILESQSGEELE
jgi:hypothetical protein